MIKYLLGIFILLSSFTAVNAMICTSNTFNECNVQISEDHQGAVELCSDCFVCGADDGVCPEDYATGENETRPERMFAPLKAAINDRPSGDIYTDDENVNVYANGNEACEAILGECSSIEAYDNGVPAAGPSITCSTPTASGSFNNNYNYIAQCENVSRTASCGLCTDPDCLSDIKGFVYTNSSDGDNQPIDGAMVSTYHENNTIVPVGEISTTTNEDGFYNFEGSRGENVLFCGADGYLPQFKAADIIRGNNIVDCSLNPAECDESCALPNRFGDMICNTDCDGDNGCNYPGEQTVTLEDEGERMVSAKEYCANKELGSFAIVGRVNTTHIAGFQCCTGNLVYRFSGQYDIQVSDNVNNLITREYSRVLERDNSPVRVVIITYD